MMPNPPALPIDDDQAALRAVATHGGALCTVVEIDGSWSRRLGAQLAVLPDGRCVGSLADGCLEAALARAAAEGQRQLMRFGRGAPTLDVRLPCGSGIAVLVDPAPDQAALAEAVAQLDARMVADLVLPLPDGTCFTRRTLPACRLLALGAGPEVAALAGLAHAAGVAVETAAPLGDPGDHPLELGKAPALPVDAWTAIAVLFHDHEWERAILPWALASPAYLIGAQGGAGARNARAEWLQPKLLARLVSPVGLFPAARSPSTLALSVLAQVVAGHEALRR
jgi:xanthine dehydrogenase accessory factor